MIRTATAQKAHFTTRRLWAHRSPGGSLAAVLLAAGFVSAPMPAWAGNQAPVGTSGSVSTALSTAYTFQTADFGFTDPNDAPADTFSAVKIATLPALGSLTLNGAAVTAGQLVTVADIAAGKLVYTPVPGASGSPYSNFTFQVQDSGTGNTNRVTFLTDQNAIASALNNSGNATEPLPTSQYPNLAVNGTFLSGSNTWGTYQPPVATVTSTLFNASVTYPTRYLDEPGANTPRNSSWTFQNSGTAASAAALATADKTYTYVFGVAGLGGEGTIKTITSNVSLTVIGNGDAFSNATYSYLDGQDTNNALGLTGTVVSTNPLHANIGQGYTFFSLPANASSITLTESGSDPGGIVFGVIETTLASTLDPSPKTMAINVRAGVPAVPTMGNLGLVCLTLVLAGMAAWRSTTRRG